MPRPRSFTLSLERAAGDRLIAGNCRVRFTSHDTTRNHRRAAPQAQQGAARKRALLIDRYPNARNSLAHHASSMGVTAVHNAGNSAEVLRQVKAHSFDIILSAYQLEDGRDGQQLLEELRQQHLVR
jgi:PleD family two-component response regulator